MEREQYRQMPDDVLAQVVAGEQLVDRLRRELAIATTRADEAVRERNQFADEADRVKVELIAATLGVSAHNLYEKILMEGIKVSGRMFREPRSVIHTNGDELRVMVDCADNSEAWFHLTIPVPLLLKLCSMCCADRDDLEPQMAQMLRDIAESMTT